MTRCSAPLALAALLVAGCGQSTGAPDAAVDAATPALDYARAEEDLLGSSCLGTPDDCGPRGACTSCKTSSYGHACVKNACGCASPDDCDPGRTCAAGVCTRDCSAGAICNRGCCQGGVCVVGTQVNACGTDGKACVSCTGANPSCVKGVCAGGCVVGKLGDPGVCGMGFCCGANDQCEAVSDATCGAPGSLCADCAQSVAGVKCIGAMGCGCMSAADCQRGQACKGGVCGAACDANSPCQGGCCSAGKCVDGTMGAACATGAALCVSCVGNPKGAACVTINNASGCGCNSQADCPVGQACDPAAHLCGAACNPNAPCNGGCCMGGQCAVGNAKGACGANGGACVDCTNNANGYVCIAVPLGGHCGCNQLADCPMSAPSCDANLKICSHACSANLKCLVGCCTDANAGMCVNGTDPGACGSSGICVNCGMNPSGGSCRANQMCGCDVPADCPVGQACDPVTHACVTRCAVNQPCHGGCCNAGTCAAGMGGGACGGAGAACRDCTQDRLGHACVGGACGCAGPADCGPLQACDAMGRCTSACNANQPCNRGCCLAGQCADGSANSGCGAGGLACLTCTGATPTCDTGKCTAACGALGNGNCSGGNCCQGGMCTAGNLSASCGDSGACLDCTSSPSGSKCVTAMAPFFCGCGAKEDCPAASGPRNTPGQACDTSVSQCTTSCGAMGLTGCHGGCCSGANGLCRGGGQDTACGSSGTFCTDCFLGCNLGPVCNPNNGSCGCSKIEDCFYGPNCMIASQREACSIPRNTCCIPSWFNGNVWEDGGDPKNCCSGMSNAGICTCIPVGQPSNGDAARCCSQHEQAGTCSCLKNGATCLLESDSNGECCSGQCQDNGGLNPQCVASTVGQPCQSPDGCMPPLMCNNKGLCN